MIDPKDVKYTVHYAAKDTIYPHITGKSRFVENSNPQGYTNHQRVVIARAQHMGISLSEYIHRFKVQL